MGNLELHVAFGLGRELRVELFGHPLSNHTRVSNGEIEFFIDNLLVQIHLSIEVVLVDLPCTMRV